MMKEEQYFINKGNDCSPKIPTRFTNYLDKNNFLSEFQSEESKQNVKDNLGITLDLMTIKNLIDRKVIESGNIAWDLIPTEGNTENVLSSDSLYKQFLKYITKEELDEVLQEIFSTLNIRIDEEQDNRETEDQNLSGRIQDLQTLYNSLKETLYQQIISSIIENYEKRIKAMEAKVDSFLKSTGTGVALANEFGDNTFVGVNQKVLTDSINKIWKKIEDITGEAIQGINMIVSPTYFISEDDCQVHIQANTVETNGVFEHIAFYINGELIAEADNTDLFEYETSITETSVIKCVAKIMGIEYTQQKIVTHYNSFWLGAGSVYTDIMDVDHLIPITNGMRGAYNVDVADGQRIIIIVGDSLKDGFLRADLNSVEIPFTETSVTVDGKGYRVYISEPWSAGSYNIDING